MIWNKKIINYYILFFYIMNYKTWLYVWQIVNIYPYVLDNIISVNNIFCTPPENIMSMFTLPNAKVFQSSPGVKIFLKVFLQGIKKQWNFLKFLKDNCISSVLLWWDISFAKGNHTLTSWRFWLTFTCIDMQKGNEVLKF